jgi:hypothetical protein
VSDINNTQEAQQPATTTSLALASANMGVQLAPNLFRDIDFTGLSSAMTALENASDQIPTEEKKAALDVVGQWETNVLARLRSRLHEMQTFVALFKVPPISGRDRYNVVQPAEDFFSNDGYAEGVAKKTDTEALLQEVAGARIAWQAVGDLMPEKPYYEDDEAVSQLQVAKDESDYKLAMHEWNIQKRKAERAYIIAFANWMKEVVKHDYVQDTIRQANKFTKNINQYYQHATDQAQAAKLNIAISSKAARDALRELLNFSIEL